MATVADSKKPKRKVRKVGFEGPFAQEQIFTWAVQPFFTITFYLISGFLVKNSQNQIIFLVIYSVAMLIALYAWLSVSLIDPAPDPLKSRGCFCFKKVQEVNRYCQVCRKTVMGLDHHCTWLNTCIGRKNYHFFFTLVFSFWIQYLTQFVMNILIITSFRDSTITNGILAAIIILLILSTPMLMAFSALFFFHCYLMFKGYGTYDFLAARREAELKQKEVKVDPEVERLKKERIEKKQADERAAWLKEHNKKEVKAVDKSVEMNEKPGVATSSHVIVQVEPIIKEKEISSPMAKNNETDSLLPDLSVIKVSIKLIPHTHTLLCDRKERVCTAIGKYREDEKLGLEIEVKGKLDENKSLLTWQRRGTKEGGEDWKDIKTEIYHPNWQYQISVDDIDKLIRFKFQPVSLSGEVGEIFVSQPVGPCEAAVPKMYKLQFKGDFKVGSSIYVQGEYQGGIQGPSEYWWVKIMEDGSRNNEYTKARPIKVENVNKIPFGDDPRLLTLTKEDLGCKFKVKVRPFRIDGFTGEVQTSNISETVCEGGKEVSTPYGKGLVLETRKEGGVTIVKLDYGVGFLQSSICQGQN